MSFQSSFEGIQERLVELRSIIFEKVITTTDQDHFLLSCQLNPQLDDTGKQGSRSVRLTRPVFVNEH